MQNIYLIRHAESYSNIGEPSRYTETVRITDTGIEQSKILAGNLKKPSKIIISKYIRTLLTATPFIEKYPETEVVLWSNIHEFDYIDREKYMDKYANTDAGHIGGLAGEYWHRLDPHHKDAYDVESFVEFTQRVHLAMEKIKKLDFQGNIYIFTHSHFIRLFMLLSDKYKDID